MSQVKEMSYLMCKVLSVESDWNNCLVGSFYRIYTYRSWNESKR
jgi:hypothetical protein